MKNKSLILFLPGLLCLLVSFRAYAPTDMAQMMADWQRAKAFTKEYLDAMPEDGTNFKPNADVRSFADQMLHIANANYAFASAASGKENPMKGKNLEKMEEMHTKAALDKAVMDSYDFVLDSMKGMSAAQMGEKTKVFGQDVTREMAFAKAFEHQTHHRGQTTLYLRMKGVKPPNEKLF